MNYSFIQMNRHPAVETCQRRDLEALKIQISSCTPHNLKLCVWHCVDSKFIDGLHLLIETGIPIDARNQNHIIRNNWIDLVERLMDRGNNIDFNDAVLSIRSIEMLDLFLAKGLDINYKTSDGVTLMMGLLFLPEDELIGGTRHQFLHALLDRGADLYAMVQGMNGVVITALKYDDIELLKFCDKNNIDLLSPLSTNEGNLLHGCVFANAIKCALYLLDLGIDRTVTDRKGKLGFEIGSSNPDLEGARDEIMNLIKNYEGFPLIKEPVE
jgi:hypothetical protein